jgi:hypothetical protein
LVPVLTFRQRQGTKVLLLVRKTKKNPSFSPNPGSMTSEGPDMCLDAADIILSKQSADRRFRTAHFAVRVEAARRDHSAAPDMRDFSSFLQKRALSFGFLASVIDRPARIALGRPKQTTFENF